jgi:hypothetical protein
MLEGLFNPLHLLLMLILVALVCGLPLLLVFLIARWLDKSRQHRPGIRVSFVGVATGGITDVVASGLFAIPLVIYLVAIRNPLPAPGGVSCNRPVIHSSVWTYGQLAIGLRCSVLGGYVAARIAKHDELLNGLLSSFLCVAFGIYPFLSGKAFQPVLEQSFLLITAPAFALLGGYLRHTQKRMASQA